MWHRDKVVAKHYDIGVSTLWSWVQKGTFPKPVKISDGCSRWSDEMIIAHNEKAAAK